jgi:hypothetical protein
MGKYDLVEDENIIVRLVAKHWTTSARRVPRVCQTVAEACGGCKPCRSFNKDMFSYYFVHIYAAYVFCMCETIPQYKSLRSRTYRRHWSFPCSDLDAEFNWSGEIYISRSEVRCMSENTRCVSRKTNWCGYVRLTWLDLHCSSNRCPIIKSAPFLYFPWLRHIIV